MNIGFLLNEVHKVKIVGDNGIDWWNITITFVSVFLAALLAYKFSLLQSKKEFNKNKEYNLLHDTISALEEYNKWIYESQKNSYIILLEFDYNGKKSNIYSIADISDNIQYMADFVLSKSRRIKNQKITEDITLYILSGSNYISSICSFIIKSKENVNMDEYLEISKKSELLEQYYKCLMNLQKEIDKIA